MKSFEPCSSHPVEQPLSDMQLREAVKYLSQPTEAMILDEDLRRVAPNIDALLACGNLGAEELQAQMAALGAKMAPLTHLRGGTFTSPFAERSMSSILSILQGLYLPVGTADLLVPATRRYRHAQTWPSLSGSSGSAVASIDSGKLITIQSATLATRAPSTWAGIYIGLRTELATHGQLSRITFQPEIDWIARHYVDIDQVWKARVDGSITFTNRIWLVAYEYNIATRQFEPLTGTSARAIEAARSFWYVNSLGMSAYSGRLRDAAANFQFIASPSRDYLLGVVLEAQASQDLRSTDAGRPIQPPNPNQFIVYTLFKADVPAMWVSHEVLAR